MIAASKSLLKVSFRRVFKTVSGAPFSYSFASDEFGNVDTSRMPSQIRTRFEMCVDGSLGVTDAGVERHEHND